MLRWHAWRGTWQDCRGSGLTRIATCALQCWRAKPQLSALRAGAAMMPVAIWHENLPVVARRPADCFPFCSALVLLTAM